MLALGFVVPLLVPQARYTGSDPLGVQARLTAPDAAARDSFGWSVALDWTTAAVGARHDDTPSGLDAGSAYVFVRSETAWSPQSKLTAPDGSSLDYFGYEVELDGDIGMVGVPYDDGPSGTNAGSAYVFVRSGTAWSVRAHLTPSVLSAGDQFASAVALNGGTAVMGARFDDTPAGTDAGSAYVSVPM